MFFFSFPVPPPPHLPFNYFFILGYFNYLIPFIHQINTHNC